MKRKLWKLVIPALLVIALIGYTAISAQGEFVQASYEIELQKPGAELEDAPVFAGWEFAAGRRK